MASKLLLRTKQDVIYYFPSSVSCPILFPHFLSQMSCDIPVDISPTGKESDCMLSHFSHVRLWATLCTAACQAPLSMGFSKQEYWSGLPCPLPGDLPDPGIKPVSPESTCIDRQVLFFFFLLYFFFKFVVDFVIH